ncbi:hypothetical protein SDC9_73773 [bioreactor metagenome]|uniref:Uncharacterized protein n=1 Tax=bioreactor metagenome TaxID=1076179 RepID=A0A644YL96_9ZZZZ
MFAAQKLRGLAEDDCRAQVHQLIRHIADHAVGGHAGGGVGRAALNGHGYPADVNRAALEPRNFHYQLLRGVDALLDGGAHAAQLLNADDLHRLARFPDLRHQPLMIGSLAAEADYQRRADVGAAAQADQRFGHLIQVGRELAAALMMEIAHRSCNLTHNGRGHISGTGYAWNDGNHIAAAHLSVRADIAHKLIAHPVPPWPEDLRARACCPDYGRGHIRPGRRLLLPRRFPRRI